jgi:hypothetical protein
MSLGMIVMLALVVSSAAAAFFMVRRFDARAPNAHWVGRRQLMWALLLAAIVAPGIYVMIDGAFEGAMALPNRSSPTRYIYQASQPVAFWIVLSLYFLLSTFISACLAAASYLALRSSRVRA